MCGCYEKEDVFFLVDENLSFSGVGDVPLGLSISGDVAEMALNFGNKEFYIDINFCPLCGRKLRDKVD